MYYSSPTNSGNENLTAESCVSYEIGTNLKLSAHKFNTAIFMRLEDQLIDWIYNPNNSIWYAQNISAAKTSGFEFGYQINPQFYSANIPLSNISINYTYLDRKFDAGDFISKYVSNYLRHQIITTVEHNLLTPKLKLSWYLRYTDRVNFDDYFLTDVKFSYLWQQFRFFMNATNIFNKEYYEVQYIPMPGRWIKVGFSLNLGLH